MKIKFHRNFEKAYSKVTKGVQRKVKERIGLFIENEFNSLLNNHPLQGKYEGYRSINITSDIRAIYKKVSDTTSIFVALGSHNNLYK